MTYMPVDNNNISIPALRLKEGGAHRLEAANVVAKNIRAFDAGTRVVSVYAEVPVFIAFGGASVSADDSEHYFPANVYYDFAIGGDKVAHASHVAVLAASADAGAVYISEKN